MLRSMNNLAQEINASHLKGYLLHFSSCYCHLCTDTVTKAHFRVFFSTLLCIWKFISDTAWVGK